MELNVKYNSRVCDDFFCCCLVTVLGTSSAFSGELLHSGELQMTTFYAFHYNKLDCCSRRKVIANQMSINVREF